MQVHRVVGLAPLEGGTALFDEETAHKFSVYFRKLATAPGLPVGARISIHMFTPTAYEQEPVLVLIDVRLRQNFREKSSEVG